jgi:predicted metal-dependent hydrolase
VRDGILTIFLESYRDLRPETSPPALSVQFFPFANVNNTIRLREGKLLVRLSDLLEGAPEAVLRAIAHILVAKMYRKPISQAHASRYRKYVHSPELRRKAHLIRQLRGRKRLASPRGSFYDLDSIFESLNLRFFGGMQARPKLSWSQARARNLLGHYDPAHNAIIVSRIFDHPKVPRYAVEYIVYHEMLHLRHPVKLNGSRRCVHSAEFSAEEKLFPELEQARSFIRRM